MKQIRVRYCSVQNVDLHERDKKSCFNCFIGLFFSLTGSCFVTHDASMSSTSTSTTTRTKIETTFSYIIPEVTYHISLGTIPGNHIGTASSVSFSHPQLQTFFPYYLSEVTGLLTPSRIVEVVVANFFVPVRERRRKKEGNKDGRQEKRKKGEKKYIVNHSLVTHPFSGSMSCSGISASFCHLR